MFVLGTHFNAHNKINMGALSVMVYFVMVTLVQLQVRLLEELYLFHTLVDVCLHTAQQHIGLSRQWEACTTK